MKIPMCRWRGAHNLPSRFSCSSPKLIVSPDGVDGSICGECPYVDHDPPEPVAHDRQGRRIELPTCTFLGSAADRRLRPDNIRDWRNCDRGHGIVCQCRQCAVCSEFQTLQPLWKKRINLAYSTDPKSIRFNGSIVRYRSQLILCYRVGWGGGYLRIATLDEHYRVCTDRVLTINHPHCSHGQEDPRLFVFRDKLHVSFCGTERVAPWLGVHVLVAELTDDLQVKRVWYAHYARRTHVEKNWVMFDSAQAMYAIYSTIPNHQVLRIQENAILSYSTPTHSVWQGGHIRGGAAPVLYRGEWWHWFHGWKQHGDHVIYSVGLLTFERWPPFRVTRMSAMPILASDQRTYPAGLPSVQKSIVFPLGAFVQGSEWIVSYGLHDSFVEVCALDVAEVDSQLVPVS